MLRITIEIEDAHIKDYFQKDGTPRMNIVNAMMYCVANILRGKATIEVGVEHTGLAMKVRKAEVEKDAEE